MNRRNFIQTLGAYAATPLVMTNTQLISKLSAGLATPKMPVLFLGHGSPMNAIEENEFVQGFRAVAKNLPRPKAILCISAHWETRGTQVTAMLQPRTIHDFGGFPKALFDVQYPAPGSPWLAAEAEKTITTTPVIADQSWGLDHGTWSVLKHLYPEAEIPVVQLSLDYTKQADWHYKLAKELAVLRQRGVLIIGSGNMVHNLRLVAWDKLNTPNYPFDWAEEASIIIKSAIVNGNHDVLMKYKTQSREVNLAIPTPEHFLPLLYILALQSKNETPILFNDKAVGGSLTMTSVKIA